jgi:4-diphosphocytidyl-2-C-methyl-D-erythritol kinase
MTIEGRAPAKLNLTLEVLGRRADGYHEVASVMYTLSLCDALTLELPPPERLDPARGEFHIVEASDSPPLRDAIPTDSRNLVWQAVARFVALTPSPSPAAWERGDARQQQIKEKDIKGNN